MNTKIFLIALGVFVSSVINAQNKVGINTTTPKATLDVKGKATDAAVPDGVIAPRLTRQQLIDKSGSYNSTDHTGTIVYVTDLSGTPDTKTADVTSTGYYQFDGTKWVGFMTRAFVSIVKKVSTVTQYPNTVIGVSTYQAAKTDGGDKNIVDLTTNTTVTKQGITISGKNIVIPSDGIYEIDLILSLSGNSNSGVTYRMYIGDPVSNTSLMENWLYLPTNQSGTAPVKYVGEFKAGANVDFRISTSGGAGGVMQFTIMAKKL